MFITSWLIAKAILLAFGVWWCLEMFPRWRDDLSKFRKGHDSSDRVVAVFLWASTALIAYFCVRFLLAVVGRIFGMI